MNRSHMNECALSMRFSQLVGVDGEFRNAEEISDSPLTGGVVAPVERERHASSLARVWYVIGTQEGLIPKYQ